jgi:hypothetical protein
LKPGGGQALSGTEGNQPAHAGMFVIIKIVSLLEKTAVSYSLYDIAKNSLHIVCVR